MAHTKSSIPAEPEQGLALALENRPDAILLDLRMPKYSGYELLQTFTSFGRTQMIPVIIVSGEAGGETKERCKQLGATDYFEKPLDFDALRACLTKIAKPRRNTARGDVRVGLKVALKLKGTDSHGKSFEETATTENVSLNGFRCECTAELTADSIIDVYLASRGDYVGKASIAYFYSKGSSAYNYGCRFIEKTGPWVLQ